MEPRSALSRAALIAAVLASLEVLPLPAAAEPDAACPPDAVPVGAFEDTTGSPHAPAVDCVFWHAITSGASTLGYAPAQAVPRDQMAAFVGRTVDAGGGQLPPPRGQGFTDVGGNRHEDWINQLAEARIVEGVSSGTYLPRRAVRRDQMASFVVRAYEHVTGEELERGVHTFTDVHDNVHEEAIGKATTAGFTEGTSTTTYSPGRPVRRDQMARFVARMLGRLVTDGHMAPPEARFEASARPLPADVRGFVNGRSWRPGCPASLDELALVALTHHGFTGGLRWGRLIVHVDVAARMADTFERLHAASFPVERMRLVDHYGGDDEASMADNNTSAFNCRPVTGGQGWSAHAYGTAVDINPVQNPYVRGDTVLPAQGRAYTDRDDVRRGMIVRPGPVVDAFAGIGWQWGGDWRTRKDYMHVERS